MLNPGSAGLTADRLGDAQQWAPPSKRASPPPAKIEATVIVKLEEKPSLEAE